MYDEDDTSATVTSNVLRIDAKSGEDTYVTPGYITFDQHVTTPNATRVDPNEHYEPEDASEFSYHKFLYSKNTDYACIIVEPLGDHNLTSYDVYLNFKQAPTLLEFDVYFEMTKKGKWQHCLPPTEMKGHQGLIYVAVRVPGYGKYKKTKGYKVIIHC